MMFCLVFGIWSLGFSQDLVYQSGDTLKFFKDDSLINQWVLGIKEDTTSKFTLIQRAKIGPSNKYFLLYEEKHFQENSRIETKVSLYNARRKKVWTRTGNEKERFSFELTSLSNEKVYLFVQDSLNTPLYIEVFGINNTKKSRIDLTGWNGIVKYEVSPNQRYILFQAKKPYYHKMWDYIFFIDLKTKKTWDYLFPYCFSCKRGKIDLKVDDTGKSDVVYKNEHRIFDKEGNLVDVFVKID